MNEIIFKSTEHYFNERMNALGITEDLLEIDLYKDSFKNTQYHKIPNVTERYKIFEPNEKGIGILLYSILGEVHWFRSIEGKQKTLEYRQTRLLHPKQKKDSSIQKYDIPRGQKTLPFFPPVLLKRYEASEDIEILYLTEGHFKAFKAMMHGIYCVGVPSITCLKDGDGLLHEDILKLIRQCNVQKVVWLHDGDCRNVTSKEIKETTDLATRPHIFFKSVEAFHDLLSKEGARLFFAHINSEELEGNPKGLDDLLCAAKKRELTKITDEFNDFRMQKSGFYSGTYLSRIEITRTTSAVYKYFMLHDVDEFYRHHSEVRPELRNVSFKFFGTTYKYDTETPRCSILIPKGALNYFRVGDTYYQYVEIPDQWNNIFKTFERREKKTIQEDNDKDIFKHIPKYTSFCNVPSHTDYRQVIHNCYNLYHPFEWEPNDEIDCHHTLNFVKHIFGNEIVLLNESDISSGVERWELGLDYLQLLYQKPQQILPILCLVSVERQTGKTTFGDWLKEIYKENMAIVGNADLRNDFNSHWLSKLVVMVDETKVDKDTVLERLKSLSTAKTAIWNSKGKDQKSIGFFSKFILNSNRVDDFIRIDKEEIRFWVIKVPSLTNEQRDVNLLKKMIDEIPGFICYLGGRKMKSQEKERHWFETRLLVTDALKKVVASSKMSLEKQFEIAIAELFEVSGDEIITMPLMEAASLVKQHHNKSFVSEMLRRKGYKPSGSPSSKHFPRIIEKRHDSGEIIIDKEYIRFRGRYYIFRKEVFIQDAPNETND